jgi:hypothetical protein
LAKISIRIQGSQSRRYLPTGNRLRIDAYDFS